MGPGSGRPAGPPRPRRGGAPGPAEGRAGAPPRPPRSPSANPDLDVAEARAAGAVADVADLPRLALPPVPRAGHDVGAGAGARGAGDGGQGVGAGAEAALELVHGQEARPRVRGLGAEDAVQLSGVAAALVDLQVEL